MQKLADILKDPEASDNDKFVAHTMLMNQVVSAEGELPTCQDTGTAIVIGKKGADIDVLRSDLEKVAGVGKGMVAVDVIEVKRPELDANLVAQSIAEQLEGRVAFRRAMRKAVQSARKAGAKGIRIQCSGRLGGAEMGRREWYREGRVPLHTLRAKIDYGTAVASTTMGACGVKVWIYLGEKLPGQPVPNPALEGSSRPRRRNSERRGQ